MKQLLIALIIVFFSACKTTPTVIEISTDKSNFTQTSSSVNITSFTSIITNTTNANGTILWDFSETTSVTGWDYTISINNTIQTTTNGSFDLTGAATATIVLCITPNSIAGSGQGKIVLKDKNNDVILNTLT